MSSSAKCSGCLRAAGHEFGCRYAGNPRIPPSPDPASYEAGRKAAFIAAVEECEAFSKSTTSEEAKAVAMNLAVRITRRAKQER